MKGRIYLSEDRGGCALIAAALDVMSGRGEMPDRAGGGPLGDGNGHGMVPAGSAVARR